MACGQTAGGQNAGHNCKGGENAAHFWNRKDIMPILSKHLIYYTGCTDVSA